MIGIDISHWNVETDWQAVKNSNVEFVILKLGGEEGGAGSYHIDDKFHEYYEAAKKAGLHVGCYWFLGNRETVINADPRKSAEWVSTYIKGHNLKFDFPVFLDVENQNVERDGKEKITSYVSEWCKYLQDSGFYVGIYGSDISTFKEELNVDSLQAFDKWVARYGKEPSYVKSYGMWQYTSEGAVNGIKGKVDMDVAYLNYPVVIANAGLNYLEKECVVRVEPITHAPTLNSADIELIKQIIREEMKTWTITIS